MTKPFSTLRDLKAAEYPDMYALPASVDADEVVLSMHAEIGRLRAENEELREALHYIAGDWFSMPTPENVQKAARAALAKHKEQDHD